LDILIYFNPSLQESCAPCEQAIGGKKINNGLLPTDEKRFEEFEKFSHIICEGSLEKVREYRGLWGRRKTLILEDRVLASNCRKTLVEKGGGIKKTRDLSVRQFFEYTWGKIEKRKKMKMVKRKRKFVMSRTQERRGI